MSNATTPSSLSASDPTTAPASTLPDDAARDTTSSFSAISAPTPSAAETCAARQPCTNPRDTSAESGVTQSPADTCAARHDDPIPAQTARHVARDLPPWQDLTEQQVATLDLLASGLSVTQIAARLNIHRGTIHRWKTQHPAFIAALNRRRQDSLETLSTGCTRLLSEAIHTLERNLVQRKRIAPQRFRSALAILRTFGDRRQLLGSGPTSPSSAARQLAVARRLELYESLKKPIDYPEIQKLLDELRYDFYDEHSKPLPPCDLEPSAAQPAESSTSSTASPAADPAPAPGAAAVAA